MNSQQIQKTNSEQSPSFDDVSKLFALPLSEAADILGVSAAVLKKICIDNGLDRWPHRKYLSGKTIEEIKKEAARERNKALSSSRNNLSSGSISSSQFKDKSLKSPQEMSKLNFQQQSGSRSVFTLRPHQDAFTSNYAFEVASGLDEFKYGFPSDGLAELSNKWWGSDKSESKSSISDDSTKADAKIGPLSAIRKRALEEGQETLRFGFWNGFGGEKIGKKEKLLLTRIFG